MGEGWVSDGEPPLWRAYRAAPSGSGFPYYILCYKAGAPDGAREVVCSGAVFTGSMGVGYCPAGARCLLWFGVLPSFSPPGHSDSGCRLRNEQPRETRNVLLPSFPLHPAYVHAAPTELGSLLMLGVLYTCRPYGAQSLCLGACSLCLFSYPLFLLGNCRPSGA